MRYPDASATGTLRLNALQRKLHVSRMPLEIEFSAVLRMRPWIVCRGVDKCQVAMCGLARYGMARGHRSSGIGSWRRANVVGRGFTASLFVSLCE